MLTLIEGAAGSGKSQVADDLLESGEADVLVDLTKLWVALSGARRGPDGRYPIRQSDDPALHLARYVRQVAVRRALAENINVAVTVSSSDQVEKYRALVDEAAESLRVRTVSIPEAVARARLADASGQLSPECEEAVQRWYG